MARTGTNFRAAADDGDGGGFNDCVDVLGQSHIDDGTKANDDGGGKHLEDERGLGFEGLKEDMEDE